MMIARFRAVGWVAGCAAAALCCYLASQRVAAERLALAKVDREIADMRSDNARLQTEIATRSRLGQIERWNVAFRLGAPSPRQYLASEVQLAAYVGGRALPLDPAIVAAKGAVDTVAYVPGTPAVAHSSAPIAPPAMPRAIAPTPVLSASTPRLQVASATAQPQEPMLRAATYVRPAPSRLAATVPALLKTSLLVEATAHKMPRLAGILDDGAAKASKPASLFPVAFEEPAPRPKPARKLAASLLPTDLAALAAAEGKPHGKTDR